MATSQLILNVDDDILRNVTGIAAAQGIDVEALLLRVLQAMATRPWKNNPIGPLTRQVSGIIPDDGKPYKEMIEQAMREKHGLE